MKFTKRLLSVMLVAILMLTVFPITTVEAAAPKVSITWNANGGKIGNTKSRAVSVTSGNKIGKLPTVKRTGYTFRGWYTKKTNGTKITKNTIAGKKATYYAQWKAKQYTLTFNANGGTVSKKSKKITFNKAFGTLPTPKRYGYTFNGWYTAKDAGKKVTKKTKTTAVKNMTVYAQWKKAIGYWTEIKIIGDESFTQNTKNALDVIKSSNSSHKLVMRYICIIQQNSYSGMRAYDNPPSFQVGNATYTASTTWYASAIVHDAYHSKLYHDYLETHDKVPDDVWTGYNAEMQCLSVQISFLKEIGAPQNEIDYAESLYGTNWWSTSIGRSFLLTA